MKTELINLYSFFKDHNIEINEKNLINLINSSEEVEPPKLKAGRRVGNTTRLADYYIQKLFKDGKVTVVDHYDKPVSNKMLIEKIIDRLRIEHSNINIQVVNFTIKIIK